MSNENDNQIDIALLQQEFRRINERLRLLEIQTAATTALMNKYGGAIAVIIILAGAVWGLFIAFSSNLQKAIVGH